MPVLTPIPGFPTANGQILSMVVYKGIIYVAGSFTVIGGETRNGLAAIDATTHLVTAFDPRGADPSTVTVNTIAIYRDVIYFGAANIMEFPGSVTRTFAAAVDLDGNLLPWSMDLDNSVLGMSIGPYVFAGPNPLGLAVVYMCGNFTTIHGFSRPHAGACLTDDAATLDDFNPRPNGTVLTIVARGLTIFLGGGFTTVLGGATPRSRAASFMVGPTSHVGSLTAFDPDPDDAVYAFYFLAGVMFMGGSFISLNNGTITQPGLVGVSFTTGAVIPLPFYSPSFQNGTVYTISSYNGGLAIGGNFDEVLNQNRDGFAFLNPDYSLSDIDAGLEDFATVRSIGFSLGALDELYLGGVFATPMNNLVAFVLTSPPFPPPIPPILPRTPKVQYLTRLSLAGQPTVTLFRWFPVSFDMEGNAIEPLGYRVYRSNNQNLETFELVAEVSTQDIRGLIDTMFSEDIDGFFSYGITAFTDQGESAMTVAEAVASPFGPAPF